MGDRFKLFGSVDRRHGKPDERIASGVPSWAMKQHLDEMKESIDSKKRSLEMGLISSDNQGNYLEIMKREEERYNKIMSSRPKIEGKDIDDLSKSHKELGKKIRESMFTQSQMEKGSVDAHEEARRMKGRTIQITSESEKDLAESCGVTINDGFIGRDDANRMFKVAGSYLETESNPEALRKL